ncbi:hypothetical protein OF846_002980 [Rhodotorula toruloides]|nr:hypothetical protein OF846_002980 [Rhodotorula toruloides]
MGYTADVSPYDGYAAGCVLHDSQLIAKTARATLGLASAAKGPLFNALRPPCRENLVRPRVFAIFEHLSTACAPQELYRLRHLQILQDLLNKIRPVVCRHASGSTSDSDDSDSNDERADASTEWMVAAFDVLTSKVYLRPAERLEQKINIRRVRRCCQTDLTSAISEFASDHAREIAKIPLPTP